MLPYPISHIIENVFFIPVILICSGEHMEEERIKTQKGKIISKIIITQNYRQMIMSHKTTKT